MTFLLLSLLLVLIANVKSTAYTYAVTCSTTGTPCGQGGAYTLQMIQPTTGPIGPNLNIGCQLGDTVSFTFPSPGILLGHPFNIFTQGTATPFPGLTNPPAEPGYQGSAPFNFNCDMTLQNSGPAVYQCGFHSTMTGMIKIGNVTNVISK